MRWKGQKRSDNIDDRRGQSAGAFGGMSGGGLLRLLPVALRFLGVKGTVIVALGVGAFVYFSGGDLGGLLTGVTGSNIAPSQQSSPGSVKETTAEKEQVNFVAVVLADTEQTWTAIFKQKGLTYKEPHLVLYRNAVNSACGLGKAAMGPFYCPGDQKVYLDLSFFDALKRRHGAPGDFAQAYVIAHEVGHHVQNLLGISSEVHKAQRRKSKTQANQLSVKQELQADCFAGIWGHYADSNRQLLEQGDIEEGLNAASAIGDDRLQQQAGRRVAPESFTHGSSAQRVHWFKTGLEKGSLEACNTFAAS